METEKKYILDANCFIEPWNKFYSYSFFAHFWDEFVRRSCDKNIIFVQQEVYDEIFKKEDALKSWIEKQDLKIAETDLRLTKSATNINNRFPKLVKEVKGRSMADPFVIAFAKQESATVVTLEHKGTEDKPKIPYVCNELGVRCIDLFDFIKEVGVKFRVH